MNFVPKKKKFYKKWYKNSNGSQYKPTTIPFWVDVTLSSDIPRKANTHMNMSESKEAQESLQELTDDNSPSVPDSECTTLQGSQGLKQTTKKPTLNIQEQTHEKIELKEKQNDFQYEKHGIIQNVQEIVFQNSQPIEHQNIAKNKKPKKKKKKKKINLDKVNEIDKQKTAEKTNIAPKRAVQIPVLSNWTAKKYHFQFPKMNTPTLNNQGNTLGLQASGLPLTGQQMIYQNVYSTVDPNIMMINNATTQGHVVPGPVGVQSSFQNMHTYQDPNATVVPQQPAHADYTASSLAPNTPIFVNTDLQTPSSSQAYSPSDVFAENDEEENREDSPSPDISSKQKRLSAFKRLGPLTQHKKPKLTINLSFNKEQSVREVVRETQENSDTVVPVYEQENVINSTDEIVKKFLRHWPWKTYVYVKRSVGARSSKSAMLMEQEQMEEIYKNDNNFIEVLVKGYPETWSKEDVLDTLLQNLQGKGFIPCFINFSPRECKFLVIRCRTALVAIHKLGFSVHRDDVVLNITISYIDLMLKHLDFVPKLILRKRVLMGLNGETKLCLKAFTLQPDISHFLYFPLNLINHQSDILKLDTYIDWKNLVELNISNNRLATIEGFSLQRNTPRLRNLDVSNNYIEKITVLLHCRNLPIKSLKLEGNPLCTDYTDPDYYIKVLKMVFPMLKKLDGVTINRGDIPLVRKNFSLIDADMVVEKFLETFFPIMDNPPHERDLIKQMYDEKAILTITHRPELSLTSVYEKFRSLFSFNLNQRRNASDCFKSPQNIVQLLKKWPDLLHDPTTFTVDVMWHSDSTTVLRVGGVVKITSDSLAIDEHMLAFSRTILLHTTDGFEYKIRNEMLYWDLPTEEFTKNAFRIAIPKKALQLALETPLDEMMQENLIRVFMTLTELGKKPSIRCLEEKGWNLKDALSFFTNLVKSNEIHKLYDVIHTEQTENVSNN